MVPLFALGNAGLHVDRELLATAATSPVAWGIVLGYLAGKPLGIVLAAWAAGKTALRRAAPSLGWGELGGGALSAGVGFTVSLLIASRAFRGALLDQAKLGVLATALLAPALSLAALTLLRRHAATRPLLPGRPAEPAWETFDHQTPGTRRLVCA